MARPKTISDEELLDIARECFFQDGPQVPTRKIAEKAGISQPALFKRFGTKEDLFMAAIASAKTLQTILGNIAWLKQHPKEGPLQPQLEELLDRMWNMLLELVPRMIALHTHKSGVDPHSMFKVFKKPPPVKMLEAVTGFVKRAQKTGQIQSGLDAETVAMNIMGSLQGRVFFQAILGVQIENEANKNYIAQTAQTLCRGLCNNGETK